MDLNCDPISLREHRLLFESGTPDSPKNLPVVENNAEKKDAKESIPTPDTETLDNLQKKTQERTNNAQNYVTRQGNRLKSVSLTESLSTLGDRITKPDPLPNNEGQEIVKNAKNIIPNDFDVTKATPVEKEKLLSRLQAAGADVSAGEKILEAKVGTDGKKEYPNIKAYGENSPGWERSLNRLAGLISYVGAIFRDIKERIHGVTKKPEEAPKTGAEAGTKKPEEDKNGPGETGNPALLKRVKDNGYGAVKQQLADQLTHENERLSGNFAQLGLVKERNALEETANNTKREVETLQHSFSQMKPDDTDYLTVKSQLDQKKEDVSRTEASIKGLDEQIAAAKNQETEVQKQQKDLMDMKKSVDDKRTAIGNTMKDTYEALGQAPLNELSDAQVIRNALDGALSIVPLDAADRFTYMLDNSNADKINAARSTLTKLDMDATAWDMTGNELKNPDAFIQSLTGVVEKLKETGKAVTDKNKEITDKGASPEAAKQANLLKQNYEIPLDFKDGGWKIVEEEGTDKGALLVRLSRAIVKEGQTLDAQLQTTLVTHLNDAMKDITTPLGKVAFGSCLREKYPQYTSSFVDQMVAVVKDIPELSKTATYDLAQDVLSVPGTGSNTNLQTNIRSRKDFATLDPLLKKFWNVDTP